MRRSRLRLSLATSLYISLYCILSRRMLYCYCYIINIMHTLRRKLDFAYVHLPSYFIKCVSLCQFTGGVFLMIISNENNNNYQNILQGKLTNAFQMLSTGSFYFDKFANNANAIINNVKFSADSLKTLPTPFKFDTIVKRIFDIFILKLTHSVPYRKEMPDNDFKKFQRVSITLKEYMNYCNIKSNKTRSIEQLRTALNVIGHISVEFSDVHFIRKNKSESEYYFFKITDAVIRDKSTGTYSIFFNTVFLKYLAKSYIMPFNVKIFQINLHKNPNSYQLVRRLLLHHNMNFSKSNANIISIKSLLESTSIPTYEQIKSKGRLKQLIIEPFERDLNFLQTANILQWNYNNEIDYSYNKWIDSSIKFTLLNYPEKDKNHVKI